MITIGQTCNHTIVSGSIVCNGSAFGPGGGTSATAVLTGNTFAAGDTLMTGGFLLRIGSFSAKLDQSDGNITATQTSIPYLPPPSITDTVSASTTSLIATLGTDTYCSDPASGRYGQIISNSVFFSAGTVVVNCVEGQGGAQVKLSQLPIASGSGQVTIAFQPPSVTGLAAVGIGGGGSHYQLGSILNVNSGNGMGQVEVTQVDANGAVLAAVVTAQTPANFYAPSGYSITNGVSTTCVLPVSCAGTGATVDVTAIGWVLTVTDNGLGPGWEKMLVTGNDGHNLTVQRGYGNSIPIPHNFLYYTPVIGAYNPGPAPNLISYMTDSVGNSWNRICTQTEYTDTNTVPLCFYYTVLTSSTASAANAAGQDVVTFSAPYATGTSNEITALWYSGLGAISSVNNPAPTNGWASNPLAPGISFNTSMTGNQVIPTNPGAGWSVTPGDLIVVLAGGSPRGVVNGTGALYPLGQTGIVSTSGNQVIGNSFPTTYGWWPAGTPMIINGTTYHIASVDSAGSITPIEPLPTLIGASFFVADQGAPPNPLTGWVERAGDAQGRIELIDNIATGTSANGGAYVGPSVDGMFTLGVAFHPAPNAPPPVSVPNVVGSTQAAATTAITGVGLVVGTISSASSSTVPAGSVISESPAAGTSVAVGSTVALAISTGNPATNATATFACSGFSVTTTTLGTIQLESQCTLTLSNGSGSGQAHTN